MQVFFVKFSNIFLLQLYLHCKYDAKFPNGQVICEKLDNFVIWCNSTQIFEYTDIYAIYLEKEIKLAKTRPAYKWITEILTKST